MIRSELALFVKQAARESEIAFIDRNPCSEDRSFRVNRLHPAEHIEGLERTLLTPPIEINDCSREQHVGIAWELHREAQDRSRHRLAIEQRRLRRLALFTAPVFEARALPGLHQGFESLAGGVWVRRWSRLTGSDQPDCRERQR